MSNDIKKGAILQSYAEDNLYRYKIFSTKSLENLQEAEIIGRANSLKEVNKIIKNYLRESGEIDGPYWRFLLGDIATFIDYGSWSDFIAIVPPVSMQELQNEEK